jgi:hypothetical protein
VQRDQRVHCRARRVGIQAAKAAREDDRTERQQILGVALESDAKATK